MLFDDRPTDRDVQRRTFELRKSLVLLRRVVLPMREVVNSLMRRDLQSWIDATDAVLPGRLRPRPAGHGMDGVAARPGHHHPRDPLDVQGNRLNSIMKKVTSWAAIIAVPTAVTGFYGQNVPYPGFGHVVGFWMSTLSSSLALSGLLYITFKRKGWL